MDALQGGVRAGSDHRGAQDRGAVHDVLEGVGQLPRVVHAVQDRGEVGEVDVAVVGVGVEGVEQHAALHRGERVEVLDGSAVADDRVHGGLVQCGEREVGGGAAAGAGQGAVFDDLFQGGEERLGQLGHGLLVVDVPGVLPAEFQFAVADHAGDLDQALPGLVGAAVGDRVRAPAAEESAAAGVGVRSGRGS
nr:hypothetical protein [Streptacidiphilus sp. P02-A3a]